MAESNCVAAMRILDGRVHVRDTAAFARGPFLPQPTFDAGREVSGDGERRIEMKRWISQGQQNQQLKDTKIDWGLATRLPCMTMRSRRRHLLDLTA